MVKVEPMKGNTGNAVANQYIINNNGRVSFQSYDSIIATIIDGEIFLDSMFWNYSRTTSKYLNKFLEMSGAEVKKAINKGSILFADLNEIENDKFNFN